MDIFFQNSLTNKLDKFTPIDPYNVRIYACGPTVYDSPHIGNARPIVVFDVLFRFLSAVYPHVTYVRNITDVDDKINNKAKDREISIRELTDEIIEIFHRDTSALNVLNVTYEPRATDHIQEMVNLIQKLLENGYAYQAEGHVLFRVRKDKNYGCLAKRNLDDMIAGSRIEVAPFKEDPMDFVLWKPSDEGQPAWSTPFGKGRPGWHLECSAMSHKYLGETFDIHAGGQDLIFPHHENEIAQNHGAFGKNMANYWLHNGMLLVNGQKMSKSLGNVIQIRELLNKYDGEIIRCALLSTHYQNVLDWTDNVVNISKQTLDRFYNALDGEIADVVHDSYKDDSVLHALASNLNTPLALRKLHAISDKIFQSESDEEKSIYRKVLKENAALLGLLSKTSKAWFHRNCGNSEIEELLAKRSDAKKNRDFKTADEIRQKLLDIGVVVEDKKDGTCTWKKI